MVQLDEGKNEVYNGVWYEISVSVETYFKLL